MDTPERLPRLCASNKAWPETRSENIVSERSTVPARRMERGVQTSGKPDSLLSALQHRRVTKLQEQVERLQQRTVELEDEQGHARKQFQDRLQQVHESWQDCFERHQSSWAESNAAAEVAWNEERQRLQAQITQLSQALATGTVSELMEDAAVQAGGATSGNKSRSSQTPSPSTPHPSSHRSRGSWDLSRTQSLPQDQTLALEWAEEACKCTDAPRVSSNNGSSFADALAAFAIEAASFTGDIYGYAARDLAEAAATYADVLVKASPVVSHTSPAALSASSARLGWSPAARTPSPAHWTRFNSCSSESSFGSEQSAGDTCFLPLEEEEEGQVQPLPDQAWWEEFGEFESAPQVQENAYTQPRLVLDEDIIWLPVPAASTEVTVGSAKKYRKHNDIGNAGRFWTDMDTAQASASHSKVPLLDLSKIVYLHSTRSSMMMDFAQHLADDDDIWHTLEQPAASVAAKPICTAFELTIEEAEEDTTAGWTQNSRFPTPSSNPRAMHGSAAFPLLELTFPTLGATSAQAVTRDRVSVAPSNPWDLQEAAMPLMEISHPEGATEASVTYSPLEDLSPDEISFSPQRAYRFPVSFSDDEMEAATVEVMDMSVGDLVSVGGPDVCPWDGTSTTSDPGAATFESSAQHGQASMVEQAIQTEATSAGHSMHSRQAVMQHLLPLNCRVAARVTKLPPLDHEPQLPPLPANFILPPEMHPVLGKYTFQGTQATQTSPATSPNASKGYSLAAAVDLLSGSMPSGAVPAVANSRDEGKWLRYKGVAPPAASGDLLTEAAAQAGQSVEAFLAPMQMDSIVRDMMRCTVDNSSYLPFSTRLCDSGFMTSQLAQLLAPIRSASASLASVNSAAVAEAKDAVKQEEAEFEAAAAAVAAAEAEEAAIEAVADALLTQLGLVASEHTTADAMCGVESVSDSASEFEYISDAECEPDEGAVSRKRAARADWPQAALTKFARGHELTAAHDISSASSASATSTKLTHLADVGLSDNSHSGSVVSLADVHVEMENLNQAPAVCFAAAESASDDDFASVASSVVSDDDFEALSDVQREPSGEWEML